MPLGGEKIHEFVIPADQADVMAQFEFSSQLKPGNRYPVKLIDRSDTATGYQLTFRHHVEGHPLRTRRKERLAVEITYDRQRLNVDDTVTAVAKVINRMNTAAPDGDPGPADPRRVRDRSRASWTNWSARKDRPVPDHGPQGDHLSAGVAAGSIVGAAVIAWGPRCRSRWPCPPPRSTSTMIPPTAVPAVRRSWRR